MGVAYTVLLRVIYMEKKKKIRFEVSFPPIILYEVRLSAGKRYVSISTWVMQAVLEKLAQEKKYE